MPPFQRIKGLEVEWAIQHVPSHGEEPLPGKQLFDFFILECLPKLGIFSLPSSDRKGVFLSNGARFYPDSGGHIEYALPECTFLEDVLHYDRAGELTIRELTPLVLQRMSKRDYNGTVYFTKNNLDGLGITYGCHENYSLRDKKVGTIQEFTERFGNAFITFLIVRQLLCGSGTILPDLGRTYSWRAEPRAEFMEYGFSSSTIDKRGLINLKDEPLTGETKGDYRRLQLILAGANRNPYSTYYKVGLTDIILTLFEEGIDRFFIPGTTTCIEIPKKNEEQDGKHQAAVEFYKRLSNNPQATVTLRNGHEVTGVEILRAYYLTAEKNRHLLTPELKTCLAEWGRALTWLETGDEKALQRRVDSYLKKEILQRYLAQRNLDFTQLRELSPLIRLIKDNKFESFIYDWGYLGESHLSLPSFLRKKEAGSVADLETCLSRMKIDPVTLPHILRTFNGVVERDLRYQDSTPKSPFEIAQQHGLIDLPPGYAHRKAEESQVKPPANRAQRRATFIKDHKGEALFINWDKAINTHLRTIAQWPDPYSSS